MEPGKVESRGKGGLVGWDAGAHGARPFGASLRARGSQRDAGRGLAWRSLAAFIPVVCCPRGLFLN
eukprot:7068239-Prymnesium_polylepis.1